MCARTSSANSWINGEDNHVHLLVNSPPKNALARLVNSLKGVSSRRPARNTTTLPRHY